MATVRDKCKVLTTVSGKGGAVIASGALAGDAWTVDLSGVIPTAR